MYDILEKEFDTEGEADREGWEPSPREEMPNKASGHRIMASALRIGGEDGRQTLISTTKMRDEKKGKEKIQHGIEGQRAFGASVVVSIVLHLEISEREREIVRYFEIELIPVLCEARHLF